VTGSLRVVTIVNALIYFAAATYRVIDERPRRRPTW
jgi:hypothetical protein